MKITNLGAFTAVAFSVLTLMLVLINMAVSKYSPPKDKNAWRVFLTGSVCSYFLAYYTIQLSMYNSVFKMPTEKPMND